MTSLLLHWGVNVNTQNSRGWTALMMAAFNGHSEIVRMLLESGADHAVEDEDDNRAIDFALYSCDAASFLVLFDKPPYIKARSYEKTALMWAAKRGNVGLVAGLLHCNVEVDARDWKGKTALIWAAREGHKPVALQLLGGGADINAKDYNAKTALIAALQQSNQMRREYQSALYHSKQFNHIYKAGAEFYASEHARINTVIPLLVSQGADLNVKDNAGNTPLWLALDNPCCDILRLLIEKGANVNITNKHFGKPLEYAERMKYKEKVKILQAAGA